MCLQVMVSEADYGVSTLASSCSLVDQVVDLCAHDSYHISM